jgi:type II secretory pathway pseudopilin PulG
MAALLVGMSVMAILMSAALPSWTHWAQREKEEEYLFRAKEYARAIRMWQDKNNVANVPAPSVDLLVEQRFLRKKYKDPLTGGDFVLIQTPIGSQQPGMPGQPPPQGQRQPAPQQPPQPQPQPQPRPSSQQPGQTPGGTQSGGFIGVTSKSKAQGIKLFKGQSTTHDQWAMTYMDVPSPMGRTAQPIQGPGTTGPSTGVGGPFAPGGANQQPGGGFGGRPMGPGGLQPGQSPFSAPGGFGQPMPPPGGSPFQPPSGGGFGQQPSPRFPPVPGGMGQPNPNPFQQPPTPQAPRKPPG